MSVEDDAYTNARGLASTRGAELPTRQTSRRTNGRPTLSATLAD
jgi:hypothetical protein